MAYPNFHEVDEELQHSEIFWEPAFYDTDGSPVYETAYGFLQNEIVARNDAAALRLYQEGPDTLVFWGGYETPNGDPFIVAQQKGSFDALRVLVKIYLEDPRYTEPLDQYLKQLGFTPIAFACVTAQKELTLWLINHAFPTITLNDPDMFGKTPLFSAASGLGCGNKNPPKNLNMHEDFIFFLLDQGCLVQDSNIYSKQGEANNQGLGPVLEQTVLGAAIPYASYNMVSRLIAGGAQVHARQHWDEYPLGDPYRIINGKGVTALHIASLYSNLEGIRALTDHRCNASVSEMVSSADDHGRIPLHWALLGITIKGRSYYPQYDDYVPQPRRMDTIKLLLEAKPDTINARDKDGATAFNFLFRSDTSLSDILSTLKLLLDANPLRSTLSAPNPLGATALEDAILHHSRRGGEVTDALFIELVELLLDKGVDAHLCLHRLCDFGGYDCISLNLINRLLDLSDVNDIDATGSTAMHYLVPHMNQIDVVRHLISRGANVNVVNNKGNTPLHTVMNGTMSRRTDEDGKPDLSLPWYTPYQVREELVKIMVDAGGSMDQLNEAWKTPAQLLDEKREARRKEEIRREAGAGRGGR
ncbi:ankyrin [Penicillium verhagenii]|uniref:ankyrin n=1 Tax=Penicillium verhagenii TaxID=1562060 RepID=UPI00254505FE|nr:ankyrin [Penicillium verhagenii]KAJ5939289.1 ankyrin [Penicillium verhagenii]